MNAELEYARMNYWRNDAGMRMAHRLKESDEEMRWLGELFPLEEGPVSVDVAKQRLSEWCGAHPDDARALTHLAVVGQDTVLLKSAAAMGDAWAMAGVFFYSPSAERTIDLAWKSAERGTNANGTFCLLRCFRDGIGCEKNESLAEELLERAADLGSFESYYDVLQNHDLDQVQRLRLMISFFGMYAFGLAGIHSDLQRVLQCHTKDGSCKSVLFEVGEMYKGGIDVEKGKVFERKLDSRHISTLLQAVAMYDGWCDLAREECVAWILIAKRLGINKDVRRIIAKMVWEARRDARGKEEQKENGTIES